MGRTGSCFDNAVAESFFSSMEWEVRSKYHFTTIAQGRDIVLDWCYDFYNDTRRHSSADGMPPSRYESVNLQLEAA